MSSGRQSWLRYLQVVAAGLAVVSLVLPTLPSVGSAAFSLLIYQDTSLPDDFSAEAESYIRLTNAVLGSVMAGWFVTMAVLAPLVASSARVWLAVTLGLAVWFVPDTLYSLTSGYGENAVLNVAVVGVLAPALVALRPGAASVEDVTGGRVDVVRHVGGVPGRERAAGLEHEDGRASG